MVNDPSSNGLNESMLEQSRWFIGREGLGFAIAFAVLLFFIAAHWSRTDSLHIATLVPMFVWLILGLTSVVVLTSGKPRMALMIAWLGCGGWLADAPFSLMRWPKTAATGAETIRVVSMNCLARPATLRQLAELDPDVVLLQEAPSQHDVNMYVQSALGGIGTAVCGSDTSLIIKGQAKLISQPHRSNSRQLSNFIAAEVELTNGTTLIVISARLLPTPILLDVYSPNCWKFYAENHAKRRSDMAALKAFVDQHPNTPIILGGDFNTPARDSVFDLLKPRLRDTFPIAGNGWGKTITTDIPLHRIDQIWVSDSFQPLSVRAVASDISDHRFVVCDVEAMQK